MSDNPQIDPAPKTVDLKSDAPASADAANTTRTEGGKTYTESEVNAMMTSRLAKQEKALKAQHAEEAAKAAERAKLDEVERVKAEKADLEKRASEAEARATAAERRVALTGKVADPAAALKLLEDKHLGEDGAVNVEQLLADYPFLKPQAPAANGGSVPAPDPARGKVEPKNLAEAIAQHYKSN